MFSHEKNYSTDYALLDFGDGRRLERFGAIVLDRPCPAAKMSKRLAKLWPTADAQFLLESVQSDSERGQWKPLTATGSELFSGVEMPWNINFNALRFELRPTPFGHVGVFPEQQANWKRITETLTAAATRQTGLFRVLNLFAYTGGSSIAAALAGEKIEVVHLDAAKSVVDWARRNAALNGIGSDDSLPPCGRIRWIVEDAHKFVQRELKRGNRYEAVILDPPSYGHGPKKAAWKIEEHLSDLLADLAQILSDQPVLVLLTAHSEGFSTTRLATMLREVGFSNTGSNSWRTTTFDMVISSQQGGVLPAGSGVMLCTACRNRDS